MKRIRKINSFVLVTGIIFLILKYTIGFLPYINTATIYDFVYLKDPFLLELKT